MFFFFLVLFYFLFDMMFNCIFIIERLMSMFIQFYNTNKSNKSYYTNNTGSTSSNSSTSSCSSELWCLICISCFKITTTHYFIYNPSNISYKWYSRYEIKPKVKSHKISLFANTGNYNFDAEEKERGWT